MSQLLKVAHLVHDHRMPEMQIGRGRVKAHLDPQGRTAFQFLAQLFFINELGHTALDDGHLPINIQHRSLL